MHRPLAFVLTAALVAGCATHSPELALGPGSGRLSSLAPFAFSMARPGADAVGLGWQPVRLMRLKKMTEYALVDYGGTTVMKASANASASGLRHPMSVDLATTPWLHWRWKVSDLIAAADNTISHVEDSPARVIVTFEGGREQLPPEEQLNYDLALAMTGNRLPYATLMYIWENRLPEGALIPHHMTSRVKMIVAGSGKDKLGAWHAESHNVLDDYRRAFGEEPPRVASVGIMSDSDNTGASVTAYFGDIRFGVK
jgi:hypothetical protein